MTTATLLGYYQHANIGDDTFCETFTAELRNRGYSKIFAPNTAHSLSQRLGLDNHTSTRRAIDHSDVVIAGGGGLLGRGITGTEPYTELRYYEKVSLYCRLRRRPLYFLGVGAGPLQTDRAKKKVRTIVNNATRVYVRDAQSFAWLQDIRGIAADHVILAGDPATAIDYRAWTTATQPLLTQADHPCLGVNLFPFSGFDSGPPMHTVHEQIQAWVQKALGRGLIRTVIWFSTNPGRSEMLLNYQAYQRSHPRSALVVYDGDPWAWVRTLALCDSFLSMKLHSGVFAAGMSVPIMGVGYHPKIERFYNAIGIPEFYLPCAAAESNSIEPFLDDIFPGATAVNATDSWQREVHLAETAVQAIPLCRH